MYKWIKYWKIKKNSKEFFVVSPRLHNYRNMLICFVPHQVGDGRDKDSGGGDGAGEHGGEEGAGGGGQHGGRQQTRPSVQLGGTLLEMAKKGIEVLKEKLRGRKVWRSSEDGKLRIKEKEMPRLGEEQEILIEDRVEERGGGGGSQGGV